MYKNKKIILPSVAFDFAEKKDKIPTLIHVVPMGEWDHPSFGKIIIEDREIKEFIKNFKDNVRKGVPIMEGHEVMDEKPAVGWFKELIKKSDGLWGRVEWTEDGKELLRKKAFKFFSPEFFRIYEDPETGKIFTNVLVGGALTNKPFFKGLKAIVLSEPNLLNNNNTMDITLLLKKKFSELNDAEKTFVESKKIEFSDAQWGQYKLMFNEEGGDNNKDGEYNDDNDDNGGDNDDNNKDGDNNKDDDDKGDDKSDADGDDDKKVEGSEIKISASELTALKAKADLGAKAYQENKKLKFTSEVDKIVCSEQNSKGKISPKQKDGVIGFMMTLSEKQLISFREIVKNLPEVQMFGEIGDNGSGANLDDVDKELDKKAEAKMSEDKALGYSDAVKLVFAEDKEFESKYNKEKNINDSSYSF